MGGTFTCGPNEVMVVSGGCSSRPTYVAGGTVFTWPFIQKVQRLSLNVMTLIIPSAHVYTKVGVAINVVGVAQVKIQSQNREMLETACQLFLGKSEVGIRYVATETLEGHQRSMMGMMTVEEIYKDRHKFSKAVFEVASADLVNMGISVVSYTLKDVSDDLGYLRALGQGRTAEVKRDARIGEAEAIRDATLREAKAEEQRLKARYANDTEIAKAKRDFELKKAAYDQEVQTQMAQSQLAYELQAAKTKQNIEAEKQQILVVERTQQIAVQEQEIFRKERELESTVKKPAEAERYRLEKIADANKIRVVMEAQAEAEAIKLRGEAEAFATLVKAKADAEQLAKKADAFREYQDAAIIEMVLGVLPRLAAEISLPLSKMNKITMVSSGNAEVGVSKLTNEVMEVMEKLPGLVNNMTGVNLTKSMMTQRSANRRNSTGVQL